MKAINTVAYIIATWFKVGLWPVAPGTWGSLMAFPPAIVIYFLFGTKGLFIVTLIGFIIGTIATYFVLYTDVNPDPSYIVIDEVVGQWLVLCAAGSDIRFWVIGFIFFRVFDILKPYPIKLMERYFADGSDSSKAVGVMIDDSVAAIYAIVCLFMLALIFE
jgi:phosphatidylglycerophosphatase A